MLPKNLVIVESPAKAKTLEKFLGKDYKVTACGGHVRDLPQKKLGVDIERDFAPTYQVIKGKEKIIKTLASAAKKVNLIFLAPDPDREGEAIAWHLADLLGNGRIKRIEFNEITKRAVEEAIANPRSIDMMRVNAQQARRILDRLVGYKLSPLLWKKVRKGLSAGRVQSVAVRIICEREKEIKAFKPVEYWSINATLTPHTEKESFQAKLISVEIPDEKSAKSILATLERAKYTVKDIKVTEQKKYSPPPFITSTLQQEAGRKLGFTARKTMVIAQQLYEGVEIKDEGYIGLITYMRTDSVRIAAEAISEARSYIDREFGSSYLPKEPQTYKTKKQAQDAHEAIRPTSVFRTPERIKESLSPDQFKLYNLIWRRFVACQMSPAILDVTSVDIQALDYTFRATGSVTKFDGFTAVYVESREEKEEGVQILPTLRIDQALKLLKITPKQHFTEPKPRYTEASLVKELEARGIGRPSTYAPIIATIQERGYVKKEGKALKPTEIGMVTNELLTKHFPDILDIKFTAHMEDDLDDIVAGKMDWIATLREFYVPFEADLKQAEVKMEKVKKETLTKEICPKCGKPLVIRAGRFGEFLACSGFPKCKYTKSFLKGTGVLCPLDSGEIVERRTKKGKIFYSCINYPKCTFAIWDKPTGEKCPKCGSLLVEKITKKGVFKKCSNETCDYSEISK